jgi:hypothetical protein
LSPTTPAAPSGRSRLVSKPLERRSSACSWHPLLLSQIPLRCSERALCQSTERDPAQSTQTRCRPGEWLPSDCKGSTPLTFVAPLALSAAGTAVNIGTRPSQSGMTTPTRTADLIPRRRSRLWNKALPRPLQDHWTEGAGSTMEFYSGRRAGGSLVCLNLALVFASAGHFAMTIMAALA